MLLFDYLEDQIAAAVYGDTLFELELHDTVYQKISKLQGVRISDAVGDLSPEPGGGLKEFNVELQIVCFARVEGKNQKDRQPAVVAVFAIQKEIVRVLLADETLGGTVCDVMITKCVRGYDNLDGNPYAVANISIVINQY